jgi:hypothetical protein
MAYFSATPSELLPAHTTLLAHRLEISGGKDGMNVR